MASLQPSLMAGSSKNNASASASASARRAARDAPQWRWVAVAALVCALTVSVAAQDPAAGTPKDPPPEGWRTIQFYLGVVWLAVMGPMWVVGIALYWIQRGKQPIKAHSPNLVLVTDLVLIAWQTLICARGVVGNDYPCWIALWADWACELGMASAYCMRAWVLYFRHELTYEMLQTSRDSVKARLSIQGKAPVSPSSGGGLKTAGSTVALTDGPREGWFTRNRALKTRVVLVPFFLVLCAILIIPAAVHTANNAYSADTGATFTGSTGWNCDNGVFAVVITVYNVVFIVIFAVIAYHMRLVVDGFGIKADLRLTGVTAAVTAIVWFIFKVVLTTVNNEHFPFSTLVALMFAQTAFISHTFYPLWRTYYRPPVVELGPTGQDISSLRGILDSPSSFAVFQKFLSQEFCVENLLFWSDVEQFKAPETSMADESTVWKLGRDIFAKYIRPGASLEVNIPSELRNDIIDYFNKNGPTGAEKPKVNGVAGSVIVPSTPNTTQANSALAASLGADNANAFDRKEPAPSAAAAAAAGSGGDDEVPPPPPPVAGANDQAHRAALGFDGNAEKPAMNAAVAVAVTRQTSHHGGRSSKQLTQTSLLGIELTEKALGPDPAPGTSSSSTPMHASRPSALMGGSQGSPLLSAGGSGGDAAAAAAAAGAAPAFIVNIEQYQCQKVFNVAQENIFALMESDPYQRFKYSDLYKQMVAENEMENRKHSALQLVKMT